MSHGLAKRGLAKRLPKEHCYASGENVVDPLERTWSIGEGTRHVPEECERGSLIEGTVRRHDPPALPHCSNLLCCLLL